MARRQLGVAASTSTHLLTMADADARYGTSEAGFRNLIHNGDGAICQRGFGPISYAPTVSGVKVFDRWNFNNQGPQTWSVEAVSDTPATSPSRNAMKMSVTSGGAAMGAAQYVSFTQAVEGIDLQHVMKGKTGAKSITASFWVKSTITGTFVVEVLDLINNRYVSKSFTISVANTWEFKSITFPPDTTGVITNSLSGALYFSFWLAAGSNFTAGTLAQTWHTSTTTNRATGQTNLGATNGNAIFFTNVQIEVGTVSTPYERRPVGIELALCQRYAYQFGGLDGTSIGMGIMTTTTNFALLLQLSVAMRATPTLTYDALGLWRVTNGTAVSGVNSMSVVTVQGRLFDSGPGIDMLYVNIACASAFPAALGPAFLMGNGAASASWILLSADI